MKADIGPEKGLSAPISYPDPFKEKHAGRTTGPLTRQFGLTQFGVNRVELPPGCWSTQRHWHSVNDEAVIMISGELTLVTDEGEETLRAGDCVCFKAGVENAHHLQNRSDQPAVFYDIGGRDAYDVSTFPEMGLKARVKMRLDWRPIDKKP